MAECYHCKYAETDYETYYGTNARQYFVCGCKLDADYLSDDECEEFEDANTGEFW